MLSLVGGEIAYSEDAVDLGRLKTRVIHSPTATETIATAGPGPRTPNLNNGWEDRPASTTCTGPGTIEL